MSHIRHEYWRAKHGGSVLDPVVKGAFSACWILNSFFRISFVTRSDLFDKKKQEDLRQLFYFSLIFFKLLEESLASLPQSYLVTCRPGPDANPKLDPCVDPEECEKSYPEKKFLFLKRFRKKHFSSKPRIKKHTYGTSLDTF
jgi:hypothetical protein